MPEYDVTILLRDVIVSRTIIADCFDDALDRARKMNTPTLVFEPRCRVEFIDGEIEVKGVYEL